VICLYLLLHRIYRQEEVATDNHVILLSYSEDLGAAARTRTLCRGSIVLEHHRSETPDLDLLAALNTLICLHRRLLSSLYLPL
jgi:hypothetical protein